MHATLIYHWCCAPFSFSHARRIIVGKASQTHTWPAIVFTNYFWKQKVLHALFWRKLSQTIYQKEKFWKYSFLPEAKWDNAKAKTRLELSVISLIFINTSMNKVKTNFVLGFPNDKLKDVKILTNKNLRNRWQGNPKKPKQQTFTWVILVTWQNMWLQAGIENVRQYNTCRCIQ